MMVKKAYFGVPVWLLAVVIVGLLANQAGMLGQKINFGVPGAVGGGGAGFAGVAGTEDLTVLGALGAKASYSPATAASTTDTIDLVVSLKESFKDTNGNDVYSGATVKIVDANTLTTLSSTAVEGPAEKITTAVPKGTPFYLVLTNSSLHTAFFGTPESPIRPPAGTGTVTVAGLMELAPTITVEANNNSVGGGYLSAGTNLTVGASETNKKATIRVSVNARATLSNPVACASADRSTNGNFTTYGVNGAANYGGAYSRIEPLANHEMACYELGWGKSVTDNGENEFTVLMISGALNPIQGATDTNSFATKWTIVERVCQDINNRPVCDQLQTPAGAAISGAATDGTTFIGVA